MTRREARTRAGAVLLALVLIAAAPGIRADKLHLENGRVIRADRWWLEGDWIHYDGGAGTVGLPRSLVVRIEETSPDSARDSLPTASPDATDAHDPTAAPANEAGLPAKLASARAALDRREFQTASDGFLELMQARPDVAGFRIGYAIAEMAQGRDGVALSAVLDGLAREPANPELRELLGDLRDREERVRDALREWNEAFRIAPSDRVREKVLKAQRELEAGGDYDLSASVHFNLRYDGTLDGSLARDVIDYLEREYWELAGRLRHAPQQPITVLLYPTREFREVTRAPDSVGGLFDGKIRVPLGGLSRLDPRARGVLSHELTHAFVHTKTRGHCPRWLHEGLAQMADGRSTTVADRREVAKLVTAAGAPENWDASGFSYPAALSLTRYLESRRGFDGLLRVLDALGEGQDLDAALRGTYGLDYAALCRRWAEEAGEATP